MEPRPQISFEDTATAFSYKSDGDLKKANFIFSLVNHPWVSAAATSFTRFALNLHLPIEGIIKKTAFDHFCGGESIQESTPAINTLWKFHVGTILDYSVEGEKSESGFDATMEETIRTIDKAASQPGIPFSVFKVTGLADARLLEKKQSGAPFDSEEQAAWERVRSRVRKICQYGFERNIPVLMDAEETWLQVPIDEMSEEMMALFNKDRAIIFNTYQLYRVDSLQNLKDATARARQQGYHLGAKLVRGAYMEKERDRAMKMGYSNPIQPDKSSSDKAFNDALVFCVDNIDRVSFMCGSHNEESNLLLTTLMAGKGIASSDQRVWFAQLYGMSDNISFNLARAGYNVAKYVPYGPVRSVMPYLFRRAAENTSVAGQSSRELTLIRKELRRRRQSR